MNISSWTEQSANSHPTGRANGTFLMTPARDHVSGVDPTSEEVERLAPETSLVTATAVLATGLVGAQDPGAQDPGAHVPEA
jgi:hypothetical protein